MLMEVLGFANDLFWRLKSSSERGTDGNLTESLYCIMPDSETVILGN